MEWTTPAFAFPAKVGPDLPTQEEWMAKLAQAPPWWANSRTKTANVKAISVVSSSQHASLSNWSTGKRRTHDHSGCEPQTSANHWATKSPKVLLYNDITVYTNKNDNGTKR